MRSHSEQPTVNSGQLGLISVHCSLCPVDCGCSLFTVPEEHMAYLQPADYPNYGLPAGTTADWITAATALINSFCRRPDLNVIQYTERLRITSGAQTVRLTYLPLASLGTATSPLVSIEARYAKPRRGEMVDSALFEAVCAFSLPGQWTSIDPSTVDFDPNTGELTLPWNVLGLPYNEVSVTYYGWTGRDWR